ncbi:hypothetical protein [Streptomyces cyaneofuscatus]|uniref:hypothetical protein n=1 Tax=Streptomyces cyaneofuscatus TaxID=66883 RepID=UPI0033AC5CB9
MDDTTPRTATTIANEVTSAVDALVRATRTSGVDGWQTPGDAYNVITSLAVSGHTLIQTLEQVSRLLYDLNGQLESVDGTLQTEHQLIGARGALRRARTRAEGMEAALREALIYTSGLRAAASDEGPTVTPPQ